MLRSSKWIETVAWLLTALLAWPGDFAPAADPDPARLAPCVGGSWAPGVHRDKRPRRIRVEASPRLVDFDDADEGGDGLSPGPMVPSTGWSGPASPTERPGDWEGPMAAPARAGFAPARRLRC